MKNNRIDWGKVRQTIFLALTVVIMAQINVHVFTDNFKISIAVICLPAFVYLIDRISIIPLTFLVTISVLASRVLVHWLETGGTDLQIYSFLPETIFYCAYGLMLFMYDQITLHRPRLQTLLPTVAVIDYLGNLLELCVRMQMDAFTLDIQLVIIVVAIARTMILWMILELLTRYRLTLLSRSHAERYERLLILISRLNGEVVWMNKNVEKIESTMNTSYQLYDSLQSAGSTEAAADALMVAKDIHEIKKEYRLIMRGLSEAMEEEISEDGMKLDEVFAILTNAARHEFEPSGKTPLIMIDCEDQLYTDEPYLFLSIFHNLITNAVEAADKNTVAMSIRQTRGNGSYIFIFHDNGPGIPEEYRSHIFDPRFSTRIDSRTGVVNRGLGLPIVKDIVEQNLGGSILLNQGGRGATFTITIPESRLSEEKS